MSLYFGPTSICVDPTNDIQLVIKQTQRRALCGFLHGLIFARQIFPFETFTTHFYLLAAQGTSVRVILTSLFWVNEVPPIGPLLAPGYESICSRFERKCNKERGADRFMIYQKHFTIWQSSLAQISKCLFYERRPEILLIRATSPGGKDARVTWPQLGSLKEEKHISHEHLVFFFQKDELWVCLFIFILF